MNKNILITGGAGFIGSSLTLKLIENKYKVTILDNLLEQVHGKEDASPLYLSIKDKVKFIKGDVTNISDWENALKNIDIVVHLAALTGTGQSMYEIKEYVNTNIDGTANMFDLITEKKLPIKKIILASSRAIYGEGKYKCENHGFVYPDERNQDDLSNSKFEPMCPICNNELTLLPTDEYSEIKPTSIYGITKQVQEQIISICGQSLKIPTVALRFQNVYGPGQSLKNPYTGILSIFSTQIFNENDINIFEDGKESRDFIYIDDVVDSIIAAIDLEEINYNCFNVGSGKKTEVLSIANSLKAIFNSKVKVNVTGDYRIGDIRHNYADLRKANHILKFKPKVSFETGLNKFADWAKSQDVSKDQYKKSIEEMQKFGLYKKNKQK